MELLYNKCAKKGVTMSLMMPSYLNQIASEIESKTFSIILGITCGCGNKEFEIYRNKKDREKEAEYDLWLYNKEMFWKKRFWMIYSTVPYIDKKDGKLYEYGKTVFGIRIGKFCLSDGPKYFKTNIVKAYCPKCKKEHIIFDNRNYGLKAFFTSEKDESEILYTRYKHYESKNQVFEIEVEIINDYKIGELSKKTEMNLNIEEYSNLFTKINVYGIISDTKNKVMIHSEETK